MKVNGYVQCYLVITTFYKTGKESDKEQIRREYRKILCNLYKKALV